MIRTCDFVFSAITDDWRANAIDLQFVLPLVVDGNGRDAGHRVHVVLEVNVGHEVGLEQRTLFFIVAATGRRELFLQSGEIMFAGNLKQILMKLNTIFSLPIIK